MHFEKHFDVSRSLDHTLAVLTREETLLDLLPDAKNEVVARRDDGCTVRSHYRILGREGAATFELSFLPDGGVRFEKDCSGRVWRQFGGSVSAEALGDGARVHVALEARTFSALTEIALRGPLQERLERIARALHERIEAPA